MIYHHPADYPRDFVVREWVCSRGESSPQHLAILAPTLEAARAALPPGLHRLERHPNDDPTITEVWI